MRLGTSTNQNVVDIMRQTLNIVALEIEAGKKITPEILRNAQFVLYRGIPGEGDSVGILLPVEVRGEDEWDSLDFTGGRGL